MMATCVVCAQRFEGMDPGCCSKACRSEANLELAGLVRSQQRLLRELAHEQPGWQRWLPSRRNDRTARHSRLQWMRGRAVLLMAAKLDVGPDIELRLDVAGAGASRLPLRARSAR